MQRSEPQRQDQASTVYTEIGRNPQGQDHYSVYTVGKQRKPQEEEIEEVSK